MKFTPEQVIEMAGAAIDKDKAHAYAGFWTLTEDDLTRLCTLAADRALEAAAYAAETNGVDGIPIHGDDVVAAWLRAMKEQQ